MADIAAVFVIVAHFTVMGYGGDALPQGKRIAYASETECRGALAAVRRSFSASGMPITPDRIYCEKLELRK